MTRRVQRHVDVTQPTDLAVGKRSDVGLNADTPPEQRHRRDGADIPVRARVRVVGMRMRDDGQGDGRDRIDVESTVGAVQPVRRRLNGHWASRMRRAAARPLNQAPSIFGPPHQSPATATRSVGSHRQRVSRG